MADLRAITRLFTGSPVHRGYVIDHVTGNVVWACPHKHRARRGKNWTPNGIAYTSGEVFAQRCADKMLRRLTETPGLVEERAQK